MNDIIGDVWVVLDKKYPLFFKSTLTNRKVRALVMLGHDATPASLPRLFTLLFGDEPVRVKSATANAISQIFIRALQKHVFSFPEEILYSLRYINLRPAQVKLLLAFEQANMLLAIASFNGSGYVREAALDEWIAYSKDLNLGPLLPFLIPRLNDHVPIIRQKASDLYDVALSRSSYKDLLRIHNVIDRYEKSKHIQESSFFDEISSAINLPPTDELLSNLKQYTTGEQILFLKCVLDKVHNDYSLLDPILQNATADTKRWLASATRSWVFPEIVMNKFLDDPSPSIKQAALWKIEDKDLAIYKEQILKLACDHVRRVRYSARFLLRKDKTFDVQAYYWDLIKQSKTPQIGLIFGLLETASADDVDRVKAYLNHTNKAVRFSALITLARLEAPDLNDFLLAGALDKTTIVRKTAAALIKNAGSFDDDLLREQLYSGPEYAKATCLDILVSRKDYQTLVDILKILVAENVSDELREKAAQALKRWSTPIYITPPPDVYEEILKYMDLVASKYGKNPEVLSKAAIAKRDIDWIVSRSKK